MCGVIKCAIVTMNRYFSVYVHDVITCTCKCTKCSANVVVMNVKKKDGGGEGGDLMEVVVVVMTIAE